LIAQQHDRAAKIEIEREIEEMKAEAGESDESDYSSEHS
jgi:hypothetical protein